MGGKVLLRTCRRRSPWFSSEFNDPAKFEELLETEFFDDEGKLDKKLSVYEIDGTRQSIVRAYVESAAGAGADPPRGAFNLDLESLPGPVKRSEPGTSWFSFTGNSHRELVFQTDVEVRAFVRNLIGDVEPRQHPVTKDELRFYVGVRLAADDPEWQYFVRQHHKGLKWSKASKPPPAAVKSA